MARYEMEWPAYVPVAERRRKAAKLTEKLLKQGQALSPVVIEGRAIATTFWGKAWCSNLEAYRDYESRLPRGRTYARNGSVIDLQVAPGEVRALVNGSELYRISVTIRPLAQPAWKRLCADCAGRIDSLVELLQGRFSKAVMERLCRQDGGLFPRPAEIRFECSCPDHASMCKHVAAVLYGVGARLDQQPELLFRLRAVDGADLVAGAAADLPLAGGAPAKGRVLREDDMAALFGLDMAEPAVSGVADAKPPVSRAPAAPRTPALARTVKSAPAGAMPDVTRRAKMGKTSAAPASGGGDTGRGRRKASNAGARPARTASKAAGGAPAAAAPKIAGSKAATRARTGEPASKPTKVVKASSTPPKVSRDAVPQARTVTETSVTKQPATTRDRAEWSWKALAAARKAKRKA
jgi:hypothetical protein